MPRRSIEVGRCMGALLALSIFSLAAFTSIYFLQDIYPCMYQLPFTHVCISPSSRSSYCCMRDCTGDDMSGCALLANQPYYNISKYATYSFAGVSILFLVLTTCCCCSTEITLPQDRDPESKVYSEPPQTPNNTQAGINQSQMGAHFKQIPEASIAQQAPRI